MRVTPITFAANIFSLDGAPLKLPADSMKHLYPIYNRPCNAILLRFGRQTHKSTTVAFKSVLPCLKYENYHTLYVAPTGNQVSVFSTDKLDSAIRRSPYIRDHYTDTQTKDQITYKELSNGSKIYLRSAYHSADSIRGISCDQTCVDEIQDIVSDHIPVIEQSMGHSIAKWKHLAERFPTLPQHLFNCKIYAGTPKTIENTMERYWANSTQNEWIIKCQNAGCGKYNYIDVENIGPTCLICRKCGKPIYYDHGQWIAMNQGGFIEGYRLPQIVLNWINDVDNPQSWITNVINTQKIYSAEKYANEVLALSYAAAKHPLSVPELIACCEDRPMLTEENLYMSPIIKAASIITVGIDWGKGDLNCGTSYSTICISAWFSGKFKVLLIKKYKGKMSDALLQIDDMLRLIDRFKAKLVIADTGDGRTSNAIMVKKLGPLKFAELYEHGTMKHKIKWNKDSGYYIINRTQVMTDIFMEIKRTEINFFNYDEFKEHQSDFTGIYSEYSEQTRMTKFDHSVPDDAMHALLFSRIACSILRGTYNQYLNGGANEA